MSAITENNIVLCNSVRTAIGPFNGALKDIPATELGAIVVGRGIVTLCIGGGQGIAVALERLAA